MAVHRPIIAHRLKSRGSVALRNAGSHEFEPLAMKDAMRRRRAVAAINGLWVQRFLRYAARR